MITGMDRQTSMFRDCPIDDDLLVSLGFTVDKSNKYYAEYYLLGHKFCAFNIRLYKRYGFYDDVYEVYFERPGHVNHDENRFFIGKITHTLELGDVIRIANLDKE